MEKLNITSFSLVRTKDGNIKKKLFMHFNPNNFQWKWASSLVYKDDVRVKQVKYICTNYKAIWPIFLGVYCGIFVH